MHIYARMYAPSHTRRLRHIPWCIKKKKKSKKVISSVKLNLHQVSKYLKQTLLEY